MAMVRFKIALRPITGPHERAASVILEPASSYCGFFVHTGPAARHIARLSGSILYFRYLLVCIRA